MRNSFSASNIDLWAANLTTRGKQIPHDAGTKLSPSNADNEIDDERCEQGRKHFDNNFFTLLVNMLAGLYAILYVPSISRILDITGKSNGRVGSFTRYLSTLTHAISWFEGHSAMKKSLREVLQLHRAASFKGEKDGYSDKLDEKVGNTFNAKGDGGVGNADGISGISQYDMVVTQWGFIGPSLVFPDKLAVFARTAEEEEGFIYIFYLVGRSLGILDEYNLCSGTLEETRRRCHKILHQVIQPVIQKREPLCHKMADHLLNGINLLNPLVSQKHFRLFIDRLLLERDDNSPGLSINGFYQFVFQNVLVQPYAFPVRWFLKELLRFNFWLADQWADKIAHDAQKAEEGNQSSIERFAAILNIPLFAFISVSNHLAVTVRKRLIHEPMEADKQL